MLTIGCCPALVAVHQPPTRPRKLRVLVQDRLWPSDMAAWRVNMASAFIHNQHFDTDFIGVQRLKLFSANLPVPFSWETLYRSHHFDRYDILIFDSSWNWLQRYNGRAFNGTRFNRLDPCRRASFLLRLKAYRRTPVNFANDYDAVFHIFCDDAPRFNRLFPCFANQSAIPMHRQVIWMPPGGGLSSQCTSQASPCLDRIRKLAPTWTARARGERLRLVTTMAHTHACVKRRFPTSDTVLSLAAPLLPTSTAHPDLLNPFPAPRARAAASDVLNVCFTTLGFHGKGTLVYLALVDRYRDRYPQDTHVRFFSVGNVPPHPGVVHESNMLSQSALDAFYHRLPIHVYVNLDQTPESNGWPLGGEAIAHGAVLFTTDGLDLNHRNLNHWGEELHVVDVCRLERTVQRLHEYAVSSPQMHHAHAMQSWRNARALSTKCHMEPIFDVVRRAALGGAAAGTATGAGAGGSGVCKAQRRTNQRVESMMSARENATDSETWFKFVRDANHTAACVAKLTADYRRRKAEDLRAALKDQGERAYLYI